jgi:pimeloyl-ACP methyl ester carboxylesterase
MEVQAQMTSVPVADPFVPVPMPAQPPVKESHVALPSGKVFVRDSGGNGPAIVLMHPATGSALIWGYQFPAFVTAGYRVIAWSRRGHYGSDPVDKANAGSYARDLDDLATALGLRKFNIVASAAGCTISLDYAMSFPQRVNRMVISAASLGNIDEAEFKKATAGSRIKGFDDLPPEFREVSPSYRAMNQEGVKAWLDLEHKALAGNRDGVKLLNRFTYAKLAEMKVPTLLLYGGADLAAPPALGRLAAKNLPNREMVVVPEAGHSIYWEQPETFNRTVLEFFARG